MARNFRLNLLLWIVLCAGCATTDPKCWPQLVEQHDTVFNLLTDANVDLSKVEVARTALASTLRTCGPTSRLYFPSSDSLEGRKAFLSLLDLAVISDDADLVKIHERILSSKKSSQPDTEDLLYGGSYLEVAAYYQARNSIQQLLEIGYNPNRIGFKGTSALHSARIFSPEGFGLIRDLAVAGADVDLMGVGEISPLLAARSNGEFEKVQCLVSLGAQVPSSLPEISLFAVDSGLLERIRMIDIFLLSPTRAIAPNITRVCSIDR